MPRFDLITLTFHENSNRGRENYWKSGVRIPIKKENFLSFFLFIFKFFTQNWVSLILTIFWYLVLLFRNQIKHVENVCFYWYLICKTRYSKMVKNKDMQFFMENLKMKRKKDKKILTFRSRDLNPRFSVIFPPMIWIFMEGEGDEIKSKQASKRDRTLPCLLLYQLLKILNSNKKSEWIWRSYVGV